jgi:hypothetical protein
MSWRQNWWFVLFCLSAVLAHVHFSKEKKAGLKLLEIRLSEMEAEKLQAIQIKEDLELKLASQNDPAWIEMVLIRELGVVPEGFLKVHFKR